MVDRSAASHLTVNFAPWLIKGESMEINIDYDEYMAKKAAIWLSSKVKKPILCLLEHDYEEYGLLELINQ